MVHGAGARLAGRWAEHDPRRRRRRDPARPQGRRVRARRRRPRSRGRRLGGVPHRARAAPALAGRGPAALDANRGGHQGRHRGDDDRRSPSLPARRDRRSALPGHQRQRLRDEVEVRQPLRVPALADRRHQPGDRRHDRRQGRGRVRLRRRRQGVRRVTPRPGRARDRGRDRPDLRAAGRDAGLPGGDARGRRRDRRHLHHRDRQQATSSAPTTWRG